MPRVVPSQVVAFIDSIPPNEVNGIARMNNVGSAVLSAVIDLVDQIPGELLTMDSSSYASLVSAKARIKDMVAMWTANLNAGHTLLTVQLHHSQNPLVWIRDALAKCPDESPAPATAELKFITDAKLRENLRNDVGAID